MNTWRRTAATSSFALYVSLSSTLKFFFHAARTHAAQVVLYKTGPLSLSSINLFAFKITSAIVGVALRGHPSVIIQQEPRVRIKLRMCDVTSPHGVHGDVFEILLKITIVTNHMIE